MIEIEEESSIRGYLLTDPFQEWCHDLGMKVIQKALDSIEDASHLDDTELASLVRESAKEFKDKGISVFMIN